MKIAYIIPSQLSQKWSLWWGKTKSQHFLATTAHSYRIVGEKRAKLLLGTFEPKKKKEKVIFFGVFL